MSWRISYSCDNQGISEGPKFFALLVYTEKAINFALLFFERNAWKHLQVLQKQVVL